MSNFSFNNHMLELRRRERAEIRRAHMRFVAILAALFAGILALMLAGHIADRVEEARRAPLEMLERH